MALNHLLGPSLPSASEAAQVPHPWSWPWQEGSAWLHCISGSLVPPSATSIWGFTPQGSHYGDSFMAPASTNKWIRLCSFFLTFTSQLYMLLYFCFLLFLTFKFSEREREKKWLGSLIVIQHEAPCWVEFSCAAVSWITRQPINSCCGSGDSLGLINLWQGLGCHIAKSMMTYLLLMPPLRAVGLAVIEVGEQDGWETLGLLCPIHCA